MAASKDFYLRYYVGHKGKFGHEFLEFEFRPDGILYFHVMSICFLAYFGIYQLVLQKNKCAWLGAG
jgi:hypothetical protein